MSVHRFQLHMNTCKRVSNEHFVGQNVEKPFHTNENQSLFGIVQGGEFPDLRKWSAEETAKLNFDGYSIGGTSVGEDKKTMMKMIEYATPYMPEDKVRYLMGVGTPLDLIEGVIRGVDLFDCVEPTRIARHGNAFYEGWPHQFEKCQV